MTRAVGAAVLWVRDCARRCGRPRAAPLLLLSGLSRRDPPPGRREYDIGKFVERRAYNICASLLCYLFSRFQKQSKPVRSVTQGGRAAPASAETADPRDPPRTPDPADARTARIRDVLGRYRDPKN